MKKLLGIVVLAFLYSGNAYSEEIILNCEFDQGHIVWGDGEIEFINNTNPVKPTNKTLRINSKKKELFKRVDDISPIDKNRVLWTDKEIKWFYNSNILSIDTNLNRYTGSLVESVNFKPKTAKVISTTYTFNCKKEEKKF